MNEFIITLKETNNPAILKFEANQPLVHQGSYEYKNIDQASNSPLAKQLFYLPFIKTVYISGNFIALERFNIVSWDDVKDSVAQQLVDYLNEGETVVLEPEINKPVAYTVYGEVTPNPAVMKFVANLKLVPGVFEFKSVEEAKHAPLAQKLFEFPFVKEVFMDLNYISITKNDLISWEDVSMEVREFIRAYLTSGGSVLSQTALDRQEASIPGVPNERVLDETSRQIVDILEEYVKPAVASDGGNIVFQSYEAESKRVHVVLQGACSGCPSSTYTLKNGIETMLKNMLGDQVAEVVAVNG
ncbi:MAG: hypothetical protein RLZZ241_1398 [Bacteroidota bacterium]|jgi:Fe-S cluster biogenesis protein NfuA